MKRVNKGTKWSISKHLISISSVFIMIIMLLIGITENSNGYWKEGLFTSAAQGGEENSPDDEVDIRLTEVCQDGTRCVIDACMEGKEDCSPSESCCK